MGPNGYGAVLGDIMARYYRNHGEEFDDSPQPEEEKRLDISPCTLFTAATATAIINKEEYHETYRQFSDYYRFEMTGSYAEDDLMFTKYWDFATAFVSPIGWTSNVADKIQLEARRFAESLQCSPHTVTDCECIAVAVFRARTGCSRAEIAEHFSSHYDLASTQTKVDIGCNRYHTIMAAKAFLESSNFQDAINRAVQIGQGNSCIATITGSLAEAFYQKTPNSLYGICSNSLDKPIDDVLDVFAIEHMYQRSTFEAVTGDKILPPEAPAEWKSWPMSTCVDFTFHQTFCISGGLHRKYIRPTLSECAVKLFEGEDYDWIFPSYGITSDQIIPAFEWYVSWPLQRRGTKKGIIRRGRACGNEGWEMTYERTLVRLYSQPTVYSESMWCWVPSKGRLMLDVGGRTKQDAVNNWYLLAKPLRRILKEVRASRRQMSAEASKRNGIAVKTEDGGAS